MIIKEENLSFEPDITKYKCRSKQKLNVYIVCDYMGWRMPTFADPGAYGYLCKWGGRTMTQNHTIEEIDKIIEEIYNATGIKCSLSPTGKLMIPYYK